MAKAKITTKSGIVMHVDGTPAEIAAVVQDIERREEKGTAPRRGRPGPVKLVDLIDALIDAGFFKKPQSLAALKAALEEMGRHYPMTTLSGAMLKQVQDGNLRRMLKDKIWVYTR